MTEIANLKAKWLFRPAFSGQCFMDWQVAGGLKPGAATNEGELAVRVLKAAQTCPIKKVTAADVIELDDLGTGSWLDDAFTANLVAPDGSGRVYAQFRAATGFYCSPAEAQAQMALLTQMPYTLMLPRSRGAIGRVRATPGALPTAGRSTDGPDMRA